MRRKIQHSQWQNTQKKFPHITRKNKKKYMHPSARKRKTRSPFHYVSFPLAHKAQVWGLVSWFLIRIIFFFSKFNFHKRCWFDCIFYFYDYIILNFNVMKFLKFYVCLILTLILKHCRFILFYVIFHLYRGLLSIMYLLYPIKIYENYSINLFSQFLLKFRMFILERRNEELHIYFYFIYF